MMPPIACVSIHARTRRATRTRQAASTWHRCFNPRPHAAGDADRGASDAHASVVSIHARTRRATTSVDVTATSRIDVSIHARTRRATTALRSQHATRIVSIHARTRRATRELRVLTSRPAIVSIHARTRRATLPAGDTPRRAVSIHARTRRATTSAYALAATWMFQSTPARGGRPAPAPRMASRLVSIHARTRRATARSRHRGTAVAVSIHARTRRATVDVRRSDRQHAEFQSTPARGGRRRRSARPALALDCFNPRPHAAGDTTAALRRATSDARMRFNPRPHAAGDRWLRS